MKVADLNGSALPKSESWNVTRRTRNKGAVPTDGIASVRTQKSQRSSCVDGRVRVEASKIDLTRDYPAESNLSDDLIRYMCYYVTR